jgi:hypothetical protein
MPDGQACHPTENRRMGFRLRLAVIVLRTGRRQAFSAVADAISRC